MKWEISEDKTDLHHKKLLKHVVFDMIGEEIRFRVVDKAVNYPSSDEPSDLVERNIEVCKFYDIMGDPNWSPPDELDLKKIVVDLIDSYTKVAVLGD